MAGIIWPFFFTLYIMKRFKIAGILVILFINIGSYCQKTTFDYLLSTPKNEVVRDVYESEDGTIFLTGFVSNHSDFKLMKEGLVVKLNENGSFIDSIIINQTPKAWSIKNILPDEDNQYTLSGQSFDTTGNLQNVSIVLKKMDDELTITDHQEYILPAEYKSVHYLTRKGLNNNIIVAGTVDTLHNDFTMYFYEFNNELDSIKAKFFLDSNKILCYAIKALSNGNYWGINEVNLKYFILDPELNLTSETYIPDYITGNYGVKWDTDTSFYLAGEWNPANDIGFIKQYHPTDATGHLFQSWGTTDTIDFPALWGALNFNNKDSIYIGGTTNFWVTYFGTWPSWYFVIQTDSNLNVRWERFYGGDAYYVMQKIIASNDGGCIIAGTRYDYQNVTEEELDIHILKLNSEGLLVSTEENPAIEMHEALVFPNPGSNYLKVRIAAQYKQSTFELFDISGKKVLSQQISGKWGVVNTTFLNTGTYIYKIYNTEGLFESGKWVKQ